MSSGSTLYALNNQVGHVRSEVRTLTATQTITVDGNTTLVLNNAANIVVTIANAPRAGDSLELICLNTDDGTTVVLPDGVTWDGTNGTATFDADGEVLVVRAISSTRYVVTSNPGSVAFS